MDKRVTQELTDKMMANRARMKLDRPLVYDKLIRYLELGNDAQNPVMARLDLAVGYECNFKCKHCFATAFQGQTAQQAMTIEELKYVANQADENGVFSINLIGGEPLQWRNLDEIIEVLDPKRFRIGITTNGWLFDKTRAQHLWDMGVERVCISLDSGYAEEHNQFRGVARSHQRAMSALHNAVDIGFFTQVSAVVTHQNLRSDGINELLKLTNELGVDIDLPVAAPCGEWRGKTDMLITNEDAKYIESLREKFPLVRREVFPTPGLQGGCCAVKQTLYVLPSGDVLPCLLIHMSLGNLFKEPLREIRARGLSLKPFREYNPKCLAGEDIEFINTHISRTFDVDVLPVPPERAWY